MQYLRQVYHLKSIFRAFIVGFLLLIIASPSFAQITDNELFIIKNSAQYQEWLLRNKGSELIPLKEIINPLYQKVFYATSDNFTGKVLYQQTGLYLCREAGERLKKVQDSLQSLGLSLLIFDAYRPYAVTVKMWEIVPDERYAANPKNGSGHNRGASVDLTLANARTGEPLPMPTGYDHFSDSAHHGFQGLPPEKAANRDFLKSIMEHFGFVALSTEWWHYSLPNAKRFPLLDLSFKDLKKMYKSSKKNS